MKNFLAALIITLAIPALAVAQQPPGDQGAGPYDDSNCGAWVNDQWVPNANCPTTVTVIRHESLAGTITSVQGHLVTIQQTSRTLTINDQPALTRQQSGRVAVGRQVVAYGFWRGGTFYATAIY